MRFLAAAGETAASVAGKGKTAQQQLGVGVYKVTFSDTLEVLDAEGYCFKHHYLDLEIRPPWRIVRTDRPVLRPAPCYAEEYFVGVDERSPYSKGEPRKLPSSNLSSFQLTLFLEAHALQLTKDGTKSKSRQEPWPAEFWRWRVYVCPAFTQRL